jgi:class 3 adenylate cyclase
MLPNYDEWLDPPVPDGHLLEPSGFAPKAVAVCRRLLLTLLFTDIVGSTRASERLGDDNWMALLQRHRAVVRAQLAQFGGREIDSCGDGFLAVFARPVVALQCAGNIRDALVSCGLQIRAGVHAGECCFDGSRVGGIAVHVAARIVALAQPMEVLVSDTVWDLVAGSGLAFADRGHHALRGLSRRRRLFAYCTVGMRHPVHERAALPPAVPAPERRNDVRRPAPAMASLLPLEHRSVDGSDVGIQFVTPE